MGYMGLKYLGESDSASDLEYVVLNNMAQELLKGLEDKGNEYNTSGEVNVALFFEKNIIPNVEKYSLNTEILNIATLTKDKLEKLNDRWTKSKWDSAGNQKDHLDACNRMIKSMGHFINTVEQ